MDCLKQLIGNRIRELRENRNLSPSELASQLGVTLSTVYNWEQGRNLPVSELLPSLATILNTTIDNIMVYSNEDQIKKSISRYFFNTATEDYTKIIDLVKQNKEATSDPKIGYRLLSLEYTHILHQTHELIERLDDFIEKNSGLDQDIIIQIQVMKIALQFIFDSADDVLDRLKDEAKLNPTLTTNFNLIYGYVITGHREIAKQLCEEAIVTYPSTRINFLLALCQQQSKELDLASDSYCEILKNRNDYEAFIVIWSHENLYRILLQKQDNKRIVELVKDSINWLPGEYHKIGHDSEQARQRLKARLERFLK